MSDGVTVDLRRLEEARDAALADLKKAEARWRELDGAVRVIRQYTSSTPPHDTVETVTAVEADPGESISTVATRIVRDRGGAPVRARDVAAAIAASGYPYDGDMRGLQNAVSAALGRRAKDADSPIEKVRAGVYALKRGDSTHGKPAAPAPEEREEDELDFLLR